MRLATIKLLQALLIFLSPVAVADEPITLRILSYNIHHVEGVDGKLDLERIAAVINSVAPDLVALQEVDQKVGRTDGVDQPEELARLTKMHVAFGGNIDLQGGHYGNAILSRFPLHRSSNHLLPNMANGEQRGFLAAEINVSSSVEPILFLATHFDHRRDAQERLASADAINEFIERQPVQSAILAGDLNARRGSQVLTKLEKSWTHTSHSELATVPVKDPRSQIDFVLFRPATRWSVTDAYVVDENVASDHRPILAVLQLLPESKLRE